MHLLAARKIPEIRLISADELGGNDLFRLNMVHKTDKAEFTLCDSRKEQILVNKSLDFADDIIPLLNRIMDRDLDDDEALTAYDKFADIAGGKAADTLLDIWRNWRKLRRKTDRKNQAEKILDKICRMNLKEHLEDRECLIDEVFSIGYNLYNDKKSDFQKGSENAFLYGYLCCLEDQRVKGLCQECGSE
jgi:hypothetical protein